MGSPRSNKSRKSSIGSGGGPRARRPSASAYSDAGSVNGAAGGEDTSTVRPEYLSGFDLLDDGSDDDDEDGSGSGSEDMDDEDIPVTGFAVASNKRNADFHELFPTVPEGDYLIEGEWVSVFWGHFARAEDLAFHLFFFHLFSGEVGLTPSFLDRLRMCIAERNPHSRADIYFRKPYMFPREYLWMDNRCE